MDDTGAKECFFKDGTLKRRAATAFLLYNKEAYAKWFEENAGSSRQTRQRWKLAGNDRLCIRKRRRSSPKLQFLRTKTFAQPAKCRHGLTAQARSDPNQNTGIIIHNSRVVAASDLRPVQGSVKTYLGRPWQNNSRTVYMKSSLDNLIAPAGWAQWIGNFGLSTLYYGEYMNTGPGAGTGGRVKWPGYRVITSATEVGKFSVGNFLAGDSWIPASGVRFTSGV